MRIMSAMENLKDYLPPGTQRPIKKFKIVHSSKKPGFYELQLVNKGTSVCWQLTKGDWKENETELPYSSVKILDGNDKEKKGNFCLLRFEIVEDSCRPRGVQD